MGEKKQLNVPSEDNYMMHYDICQLLQRYLDGEGVLFTFTISGLRLTLQKAVHLLQRVRASFYNVQSCQCIRGTGHRGDIAGGSSHNIAKAKAFAPSP